MSETVQKTFESTALSKEQIERRKEEHAEEAIDVFNIKELESTIVFWRKVDEKKANSEFYTTLSKQSEKPKELIVKRIEAAQDLFLERAEKAPWDAKYLWTIMYHSKHEYFEKIRQYNESRTTDKVQQTLGVMETIKAALKDRSVPQEAWLSVLGEYGEMLNSYDEQLQEIAPKIRNGVVKLFIRKINPALETKKSEEELLEVMDSVRLRIRDPLKSHTNVKGAHCGATSTIDLDLDTLLGETVDKDNRKMEGFTKDALNLIAHEELHAISSGQVIRRERANKFKDGSSWVVSSTSPEWAGLQVSGFKTNRFTWLNEAVTETLSSILVETEPNAYPKERELFHLLCTKGKKEINIEIFMNAYFEKKGRQAGEKGNKFWNQLRQEIRSAYDHDPQFLIKLDILVDKEGVDSAIKLMTNWNPKSPTKIDIAGIELKAAELELANLQQADQTSKP